MPTVVGPIRRRGPVHAAEARAARAHTRRTLKFTLPGPMTIVDTIADEHYGRREDLALAFAAALNEEARELEAIGVDVIQFDEPAFNVYMDQVADWGIATLEEAARGLACTRAVHICYGSDQAEPRLEGDPRRAVAPVPGDLPGHRQEFHRPGLPRMPELEGPDRADRPARRQGCPGRGHRRRHGRDREPGGGGEHHPFRRPLRRTRRSSTRAPIAAWRR